jgi:hypothetical protein
MAAENASEDAVFTFFFLLFQNENMTRSVNCWNYGAKTAGLQAVFLTIGNSVSGDGKMYQNRRFENVPGQA